MQSPGSFVQIEGATVERDVLGIIAEIQRRWPELKIQYLNPDRTSEPGDAPWRIVETCKDGVDRLVCSVWQLDNRVIDRIHAADMLNPGFLAKIDAQNAAVRLNMERRFREEMDEAKDVVAHIARSPKGRYSAPTADGGLYLFDDTTPGKRLK